VAEVEQFAAFGAERAIRVVSPFDGFVAGRTLLHKAFGGTGNRKGERQKQRLSAPAFAFPLTFDHFPLPRFPCSRRRQSGERRLD
jgi:hypothetical protein